MIFTPHKYQLKGIKHILKHPYCAEFLDMGLGKTTITLTAVAKLIDRCEIRSVLVMAPKRVCELTWPKEIKKWDHTKHLTHTQIVGSPVSKKIKRKGKEIDTKPSANALRSLSQTVDIYLANYEILPELATWMHTATYLPWDMVVWDESSKMKSASARRFKKMKPVLGKLSRGVLLSGTPAPQSYEDLWSQFYLLDRGERLGEFVSHFRDRYFNTVDRYGYVKVLKHGAAATIEKKISDITLCMQAEDYLKMPKLIHNIIEVKLPKKMKEQYDEFEREMFIKLKSDDIEALNAASLSAKCRQFTSGAVYKTRALDKMGKPIGPKTWTHIHDAKMDTMEELIEGSCGQPILVAYEFQHERERFMKRFPKAAWLGGSNDAGKIEKKWNEGKLPLMIAHPASVGHGLNLQFGGHILVFLSGTWSLELYEQIICRLYRQGQSKPVIVHHLRVKDTVDEVVGVSNRKKAKGQKALLDILKAYSVGKTRLITDE